MFRWISVGCYVPGGKVSADRPSALMSIVTAKVAGVRRRRGGGPAARGAGRTAYVIAAMTMAGADEIYAFGGVQAMARRSPSARRGLIAPVDMLVGAGNCLRGEAKTPALRSGGWGSTCWPAATETLVIADDSL